MPEEISKLEFKKYEVLVKATLEKSQIITGERSKLFNRSQQLGETLEALQAALTA